MRDFAKNGHLVPAETTRAIVEETEAKVSTLQLLPYIYTNLALPRNLRMYMETILMARTVQATSIGISSVHSDRKKSLANHIKNRISDLESLHRYHEEGDNDSESEEDGGGGHNRQRQTPLSLSTETYSQGGSHFCAGTT